MKKFLVFLICISILITSLVSCDLFQIIETRKSEAETAENSETLEEIPSGFIFTSFGDGTCAITGIYLNGSEDKVLTIPATSPDGDKVIACNVDCIVTAFPNYILASTFDELLLSKDAITALEEMQVTAYFKHYSLDLAPAQKHDVIRQDWLNKYPLIEKYPIYAFTGVNAREYHYISNILDKLGFDYNDRIRESQKVRSLMKEFDVTSEAVQRFLDNTKYPNNIGTLEEIIIPEGVKSICLSGGKNVKKITLPDSIESLEDNAFACYENLEEIIIPDAVSKIGNYAFYNCKALKSIAIPSSVTEIKSYTFYSCTSLENVVIPQGVTRIERDAFSECVALKSVTIPNTVVDIDNNAFNAIAIEEVIFDGTRAEWAERFVNSISGFINATVKCTDGEINNVNNK